RKDPDERAPHQPRAQRHQSQVAREPEERAHDGGWSVAPRASVYALHPLGQSREAGAAEKAGGVAPPQETYSLSPAFGTLYFRTTSFTPAMARMRLTIFSSCFRSEVSSETLTVASRVSSARASIRRIFEPSPAIACVTSASSPGRSSVATSSSI